MTAVANSLVAAFKSLLVPRMLALVLWPMLAASVLWLGLALVFWGSWAADLTGLLNSTPAEQWMANGFLAAMSGYLVTFVLLMLLVPAVYVTALVITAVFAMPLMVSHIAAKYYPELERKQGGTMAGSIFNSVWAIVIFCIGWVLTLPLWLFSPLALALPVVWSAYLNQRLFRYDALAEHASAAEFEQVIERSTGKLYLLGAVLSLLQFVPLLNLFSPVYIGLAFIHLCLSELDELRCQPPLPDGVSG